MDSPSLTVFFLQIAGAAALLIWSVRLVRTGVERAFAARLRLWLRRSGQSRLLAAMTGGGCAMALQSSTAVAILVANFVAAGAVPAAAGLAMVLGADLGSALVAKLLMVRLSWLISVLLLVGVVLFLRGRLRPVVASGSSHVRLRRGSLRRRRHVSARRERRHARRRCAATRPIWQGHRISLTSSMPDRISAGPPIWQGDAFARGELPHRHAAALVT